MILVGGGDKNPRQNLLDYSKGDRMQIKVIVQKSITGCLIQLEEKRKVKRATCSDIHAHGKREREIERKKKRQTKFTCDFTRSDLVQHALL